MPASWDLGQLHLVIQTASNWWNYHLHEFRVGGLLYGDRATDDGVEDGPRLFNETDVRLCDFGCEPDVTFSYLYGFGAHVGVDHQVRHPPVVLDVDEHDALGPALPCPCRISTSSGSRIQLPLPLRAGFSRRVSCIPIGAQRRQQVLPEESIRGAERAMAGGSILGTEVVRVAHDAEAVEFGEPELLPRLGRVPTAPGLLHRWRRT